MKNKHAQITIFIILGLLLLLAAGFATLVWNPSFLSNHTEEIYQEHASPLQAFIQSCFDATTKKAIDDVSLQGGYFYAPNPALDMQLLTIPFYLHADGIMSSPTKQEIAENMATYIKTMLPFCVGDFQDFNESVGTITPEEISVAVLLDETIQATLTYPLTIKRADATETVNNPYTTQLLVNFNDVYDTVTRIMTAQKKNPNALPVGVLTADAWKNNYIFTLSYPDDNSVITTLTFPSYIIDQKKYQFVFGMQYNWSSLTVSQDTIDLPLHDDVCYAGDPCYINLNIYNESIVFEDMTELFVIDPHGQIRFTPAERDLGNHSILIYATAENGWKEYLTFDLEIRTLSGLTGGTK